MSIPAWKGRVLFSINRRIAREVLNYGFSYMTDDDKEKIRSGIVKILRKNLVQIPDDFPYRECWNTLSLMDDFNL